MSIPGPRPPAEGADDRAARSLRSPGHVVAGRARCLPPPRGRRAHEGLAHAGVLSAKATRRTWWRMRARRSGEGRRFEGILDNGRAARRRYRAISARATSEERPHEGSACVRNARQPRQPVPRSDAESTVSPVVAWWPTRRARVAETAGSAASSASSRPPSPRTAGDVAPRAAATSDADAVPRQADASARTLREAAASPRCLAGRVGPWSTSRPRG